MFPTWEKPENCFCFFSAEVPGSLEAGASWPVWDLPRELIEAAREREFPFEAARCRERSPALSIPPFVWPHSAKEPKKWGSVGEKRVKQCGVGLTIHPHFEVGDGLLVNIEALLETVEEVLVVGGGALEPVGLIVFLGARALH